MEPVHRRVEPVEPVHFKEYRPLPYFQTLQVPPVPHACASVPYLGSTRFHRFHAPVQKQHRQLNWGAALLQNTSRLRKAGVQTQWSFFVWSASERGCDPRRSTYP